MCEAAEEVHDRVAGVRALRAGSRVSEADVIPVVPQRRAKARTQLGKARAVRAGESHLGGINVRRRTAQEAVVAKGRDGLGDGCRVEGPHV